MVARVLSFTQRANSNVWLLTVTTICPQQQANHCQYPQVRNCHNLQFLDLRTLQNLKLYLDQFLLQGNWETSLGLSLLCRQVM